MQFERGIYAESLHLTLRCSTTVLGVVVGAFLIQTLQEAVSSSFVLDFGRVVLWSWLAYMAHAALLLEPGHEQDTDITRIFGFALRAFSLVVLAMIPCLVLLNATDRLDFAYIDPESVVGGLVVVLLPIFLAMCILAFGFLGTILPAYVAQQDTDSNHTLLRCGRQFFWITGRLIVGPVVIFALAGAVFMVPVVMLGSNGNLLSGTGPNVAMSLFAVAAYLVVAWGVLMMTVVLSRAYLRDGAKPAPAYA
ncbi:MAG TPA: hypothetical protein VK862_05360 [Afifellaceae bacterium]|nr:hypothetical protein [Afifellaceae bacterium]